MVALRAHRRQEARLWVSCSVFMGAVIVSLALSGWLLSLQGKPALAGILLLVKSAYFSLYAVEDSLLKAVPIFLCSMGVAVAFRLQIWNIGAEGQFALGAVGATWVALTFPQLPGYLLLPGMLISATLMGGLWGLLPAWLKIRLGANEIIVTLMLNYIAILFLNYLVYGSWRDPDGYGFPLTAVFSEGAIVGTIGGSRLHWGLAVCVAAGSGSWIFFRFTRWGYELRAAGENPRAARYARLPYEGLVLMAMTISGALAGWAGFLETSAGLNRLQTSVVAGYGYTAIVVAWLAQLNPLAIALASFLLAGLRVGLEILQLDMQVPAAFGEIIEGLILITMLAGGFFTRFRLTVRSRP